MAINDSEEKQQVGKSDLNFRRRQQIQAKKEEGAQKSGFMERGKSYAGSQINRAKEYGAKKGTEAIKSGTDFVKEKRKDFLDKNPKAADAINKAQQVKQGFEDRMNAFRDSAELSARKEPIKQMPGESDLAFRRRQQKEDADKPENPQRMSLGQAAKQHAKDYGKKQLGKGMNYAKNKGKDVLAQNPKLQKAYNAAKAINDRTKAIQEKRKQLNKKIQEVKNKLNIKKKFEDEFKKLAWQYAKQFIRRIAVSVIIPLILLLLKILLVLLIIVIIIYSVNYLCQDSWLGQAVCSIFL